MEGCITRNKYKAVVPEKTTEGGSSGSGFGVQMFELKIPSLTIYIWGKSAIGESQ
jgi:hypothetical protein